MWNPSAERMFGWTEADVLGARLPILGEEEGDASRSRLAATLAGSSYTGAEMICRRRDGSEIEVSLSAAPIRDANGRVRGIMAVLEDLSPRRQLEERLLHSQKMEAIGRLAGGVAHDFNNLLTAITGHTQILLESVPDSKSERADLLEIDRAAARAASLTKQLLAFSRKQVLQPAVLELNALVSGIERMLRRLIGADVQLVTVLDPGAGRIKADPNQIEQVIMNLVVNARDAMPEGGTIIIETSNVQIGEQDAAAHGGAAPGDYVQLAITDSGVGMDRDTMSHIFEPFFTTKEAGKGTGLGLSTVYGIISQSGGHVWALSEPGQGTIFKVLLPRVETRTAAPVTATERRGVSGWETILLVEDEPAVRALARRVLQRYGYHVLAAGSGEEALAIAEREPGDIHLVVTDVVMPGLSGREVAQHFAQTRPGSAVLFTSGYTPDDIMRHRVIAEGAPFLQKPFTPAVLAAKVREVLDGKAGGRE
jgi:PAS domain S-box-containing protein